MLMRALCRLVRLNQIPIFSSSDFLEKVRVYNDVFMNGMKWTGKGQVPIDLSVLTTLLNTLLMLV